MFSFFRRSSAHAASAEKLLSEAAPHLKETQAKARVWSKIEGRIGPAALFHDVRASLEPTPLARRSVWSTIQSTLEGGVAASTWGRLRDFVAPSDTIAALVWERISGRLAPEPVRGSSWVPALRWTASVLLLALMVRVSPLIFLQRGVAYSEVTVTPTHAGVSILISGLWQPLDGPTTLKNSALIQTDAAGAATVTAHDRAVLRLGGNTTVAIHDVTDARGGKTYDPTITFYHGKLWVQSFLPDSLPSLTVGTDEGKVTMHEGSVSIVQSTEGDPVDIRVWNRRVSVLRENEEVVMFASDQVALTSDIRAVVHKLPDGRLDDEWMSKNLKLDAIHQKEIAEIQRQRLAQQAGVLPTSSLYAVKRLAEEVDVLLTIGSHARVEKRLAQAATRLNEAAALVQEGDAQSAAAPLQEFKDTMLQMASGSGDLATRTLAGQQLASAASDLSAVLPDDQLYMVKEAVLETGTAIPGTDEGASKTNTAAGQLLVDQITSMKHDVETRGDRLDYAAARTQWGDLQKQFRTLLDQPNLLTAEEQIDAASMLSAIDALIADVEKVQNPTPVLQLSEDQRSSYVDRILNRIFLYRDPRPQFNQLILELQALRTHPERGSILRELDRRLTSDDLKHFVQLEMERVRLEVGEKSQNP